MTRVVVCASLGDSLVHFRGKLLEEMVRRGHEVVACAPNGSERTRERLQNLGVQFRRYELSRAQLSPLRDLRTLNALRNLIRDTCPDVFFAYTVKPVIYGSLAASSLGVPRLAAMITGLGYSFLNRGVKGAMLSKSVRALYRLALRNTQVIIFQNPDDERVFRAFDLVRSGQKTLVVNGSGVDLSAFTKEPLPEHPTFLLTCRLIVEKGVREYAQAARILKRRYPHARFRLAGQLDENPNCIPPDEIAQWQAEGYIEYVGWLDDVRPALRDCRVYVLPSYYPEGTPRTLLEALATGRPIVTTDTPGCRETVRHGMNGLLVPPKDTASLVEAMEKFLKTPHLAAPMAVASRRTAEEEYDVRKVNQSMLAALGL